MKTALVTALLLSFLTGCGRRAEIPIRPEIVAAVGSHLITRSELEAEMSKRAERGQSGDVQQVLDELVLREAMVARAVALGIDREADVTRAYHNLLIARLKERELERSVPPLPAATSEPPRAAARTAQVRLAILRQSAHAKLSPGKIQEITTELEEARVLALKLPPGEIGFGPLAIRYSDDQSSRYRGGELGWVVQDAEKSYFDRAVLEAGFALKNPGDISSLVRGRDGLYLVRLIERRTIEGAASGNNGSALADHKSRQKQRAEAEQNFKRQVRLDSAITIFHENLPKGQGAFADVAPGLPRSF